MGMVRVFYRIDSKFFNPGRSAHCLFAPYMWLCLGGSAHIKRGRHGSDRYVEAGRKGLVSSALHYVVCCWDLAVHEMVRTRQQPVARSGQLVCRGIIEHFDGDASTGRID